MRTSRPDPEPMASDLPAADRREAEDHTQDLFTAGEPLAAPARHFGITDLQQWIDLCA